MNTKENMEKKKNVECILLNKKEKLYLNMLRDKYQYRNLLFRFYMILLISLIFLFPSSLCETNNKIILQMPGTDKVKNVQVLNRVEEVESIKVNEETVPISTKVPSVIGDGYEVTIYFKIPLTNCSKLFMNVKTPIGIDMTDFDSSQCITFISMFQEAKSFETIIGGNKFLTSSAKDLKNMFFNFGAKGCHHTINFDLFDTSQVLSMEGMFSGSCFKFLNLSSFNTEKVINMTQMFQSSQAISLDLSSFETSQVVRISQMFAKMSNLISLEI